MMARYKTDYEIEYSKTERIMHWIWVSISAAIWIAAAILENVL